MSNHSLHREPFWRKSFWLKLFWTTLKKWNDRNAWRLSASLAYYTAFSLGPLLILATGIAGLIFGPEAAAGELSHQLQGLLGKSAADAVQHMIASAKKPDSGILATVLGLVILLVAASGVFAELKSALNGIWEVKAPPVSGVWAFLRDRLLSIAMVLSVGFLLLVSLALSALISGVGKYAATLLPAPALLLQALNFLGSFFLITLLFAMIFKWLPDVHIRWKEVWPGALLTSLLFTIGKTLIGLYLGQGVVTSAYGASASFAIVLLWTYYSSLILFFGAEWTHVYSLYLSGSHSGTVTR